MSLLYSRIFSCFIIENTLSSIFIHYFRERFQDGVHANFVQFSQLMCHYAILNR